ncbi:MAG: hypothetical protein LC746_05690 [Acidobacteria bacterium]|nr:hypothetical protein [Acidobacteriota bacterium]
MKPLSKRHSPPSPSRRTSARGAAPWACALALVLAAQSGVVVRPQSTQRVTDEDVARIRHIQVKQVEDLRSELGASNETLTRIPEGALRSRILEMRYPDLQRERVKFMLLRERNEQGVVPSDALPKAIEQLKTLRLQTSRDIARMPTALPAGGQRGITARLVVPFTAGLQPDHSGWESLGPRNVGGRVRSVVVDPQSPNNIWIGSVGGGVWRTRDGGATFTAVNDLMANLAISCMAMDPTNPKIIYAGTGEGFYGSDSIRGGGIYKTTDGENWDVLPKTVDASAGSKFQFINRLAISADGKALLAATREGVFRTEDGGTTWTPSLLTQTAYVAFHPTDKLKAIASGFNGDAYFSNDGGKTWTPASHVDAATGKTVTAWGAARVELTYARKKPSVVYASVDLNSGEIWQSSDGGATYVQKRAARRNDPTKPAEFLGGQGWYDNALWAGDDNEQLLVVGGINLWKSEDGGDTLTEISTWWNTASAHSDQHAIVADPGYGASNRRVFFGGDGGIFKTEDLPTVGNEPPDQDHVHGWVSLNASLPITQFYGGAGSTTSGVVVGGAQDNGSLRYVSSSGTQQWSEFFGGDGGASAVDPTDPNFVYGEYVFLNIHRNADGGATDDTQGDRYISGQFWNPQKLNSNGWKGDWDWKLPPYRIDDAMTNRALFIAPFVLDPNNPNRILAGGARLWRTNDAKTPNKGVEDPSGPSGPKWEVIKGTIDGNRLISAVAVAPGNPDLVWVGYEGGEVYKTDNGTSAAPSWLRVDQNGANKLPRRYCTRLTVDPTDPKIVYATFGGYSKGNVWKTTDGGATWNSVGGALPEAPAQALAVHPANHNFIYLGTEVGVFASEDGGAHWSPTNEGPTSCSVTDLFWMGNDLVAVTHGRGMFKINLAAGVH